MLKIASKKQQGMLLIEVLVSLVIFSVAVLGLIGLQAVATKTSYDAEDRNRASVLANEIITAMWTQNTSSLPTAIVTAWQTQVANNAATGLPSGTGAISAPDANNVVTVTITWSSPNRKPGDPASQYITQLNALP
ncbi:MULTISPECIES: type IV pilus modification PilV family protein [unclassified Undibacterium]|uniref:type IV pilus modification PilV family protein n=1 Tax=unclassified Undibacterium TaxID=2630295 RepID=UPI002AC8D8AA|nr:MULTISPECIES: prepilin-type N-terminal cleavage/methylation domain-containing protein [unclassified Undibacterium]MEB0139489.1 prepilin-type N-terminal cleavage/methylation domain-containing protein [Undibacterium sp. CCC2.1]MEB0172402.1 prepilin-type N-terminal cleavage/methylation domain-containing protein [Undibacterium sp. CCC1.1]MEB0175729.1 prepilin-type N-terminal cleavage/methylation domain-containing protein [Undibacterium sp. CCC3.4]MEB0214517.1 prepilin-type N-terminal cleavage/me